MTMHCDKYFVSYKIYFLSSVTRLNGCGPFVELNLEKDSKLAENDEFMFRYC